MSESRASAVVEAGHEIAGRYVLREIVASGGMAQVWEADDTVLGRRVAVKILHPNLAADADILDRFRDEAKAAARLSHPSIVAIFDTASEDGVEAIVMELIDGLTLRQYLDDHGPLSLTDATDLTVQVADALEAAHAARIVHRDIKPGNIMLCPDRRTKVTDFGIAKALEAGDRTSDGTMLGTAKYLAPEQVEGQPVDERADVYSLGVVLFEALTGEPPFAEETASATALARLRVDPPPPRSIDPSIPTAVERVVLTAMARDRERRYPTATALREALLVAAQEPAPDEPLVPPPPVVDPTTTGPVPIVAEPEQTAVAERPDARDSEPRQRRGSGGILVSLLVLGALALGLGLILGTGAGRDFYDRLTDRLTGDDEPAAVDEPVTETPASTVDEPEPIGDQEEEAAAQPTPEPLLPASQPSGPPVVGIQDFDPLGDGEERPDLIALAADGDETTAWISEGYINRRFGNLKDGVGVVIRIDGEVTLQELTIASSTEGWAASVFAGDDAGDDLADWGDPLDARVDIVGGASFDLRGVRGSAILLWITDLGTGTPRARMEISEISVS
ncbi:MAG: protein kinase [Actinomycetota bacterium]